MERRMGNGSRDRVVFDACLTVEGVAFQNAPDGQQAALPDAIFFHRLQSVSGTGGDKTAAGRA